MTLPAFMYGDPARSIEALEIGEIKRTHGCSACAHRDVEVFGKWLCALNKKPRPVYCCTWRLHEEYE